MSTSGAWSRQSHQSLVVPCMWCLGRSQTAALYRQMGLQKLGLVCADIDEYVQAAVAVATNTTWRAHVQAEIRTHVGELFNDGQVIRSWTQFLRRAVRSTAATQRL